MRLKHTIILIILSLSAGTGYAATEIDLSGTWNYSLISSEIDYPPSADTVWNLIHLPNRNLFELIARKNDITKGYILYRKTVTISNDISDTLVFQAGEIMNSDIVYINGKVIGKTGSFPPDFRSGWSKFRNYPIPAEFLIKGENTIDIIGYFDAELWFISPVRIIDEKNGRNEYMYKNFIQIEFIHAFCILLLNFSLFFIVIYIKRKKEIMYFFYACTTFFLADMTILQFVENIYPYIPLSSNTIYKICGIGPMFFPPFLDFFFRSYMGIKVSRKRIALYLLLPFVFAFLMLLSQDRYYIILCRNTFLLLIPLYIADIVYISIRQIIAGNKRGLLLFISLLPIFIFAIYDIMVFSLHIFEGSVPLYPIGVPFIAILIGLQLINRFIYNLNYSEKLNILLQEKFEESKRLTRIENELSIARRIQLANVPHNIPELNSFKIGVKYSPAENISGDFYNFHAFEPERLGVLVADVSGHGIPASLIASMVKILFSTLTPVYTKPDLFIKGLNGHLFNKMEGNFLTAGYCFIDKSGKKAVYARAGHEPLFQITQKNGETILNEYKPRGKIIGISSETEIELIEFDIETGDRLIVYTDGLIEIFDQNKEIFGRQRLKNMLLEYRYLSIDRFVELIFNTLSEWNSYKPFDDDITVIIIDIE